MKQSEVEVSLDDCIDAFTAAGGTGGERFADSRLDAQVSVRRRVSQLFSGTLFPMFSSGCPTKNGLPQKGVSSFLMPFVVPKRNRPHLDDQEKRCPNGSLFSRVTEQLFPRNSSRFLVCLLFPQQLRGLSPDKVWGWLGGALESGSGKVPEVPGMFGAGQV